MDELTNGQTAESDCSVDGAVVDVLDELGALAVLVVLVLVRAVPEVVVLSAVSVGLSLELHPANSKIPTTSRNG